MKNSAPDCETKPQMRKEFSMVARKDKAKGKKSFAKLRNLSPKSLPANKAKNVRGGGIEITDYGFGVSMPVTTSRSDSTVKK